IDGSHDFILEYGYWGLFTLNTAEQFIFPFPSDPFMSASIVGGLNAHKVVWIVLLATLLGSSIGYFLGKYLGHPAAQWLFGKTRVDQAEKFVKKWGVLGVIITGLTPIPFKLATWSAG